MFGKNIWEKPKHKPEKLQDFHKHRHFSWVFLQFFFRGFIVKFKSVFRIAFPGLEVAAKKKKKGIIIKNIEMDYKIFQNIEGDYN